MIKLSSHCWVPFYGREGNASRVLPNIYYLPGETIRFFNTKGITSSIYTVRHQRIHWQFRFLLWQTYEKRQQIRTSNLFSLCLKEVMWSLTCLMKINTWYITLIPVFSCSLTYSQRILKKWKPVYEWIILPSRNSAPTVCCYSPWPCWAGDKWILIWEEICIYSCMKGIFKLI